MNKIIINNNNLILNSDRNDKMYNNNNNKQQKYSQNMKTLQLNSYADPGIITDQNNNNNNINNNNEEDYLDDDDIELLIGDNKPKPFDNKRTSIISDIIKNQALLKGADNNSNTGVTQSKKKIPKTLKETLEVKYKVPNRDNDLIKKGFNLGDAAYSAVPELPEDYACCVNEVELPDNMQLLPYPLEYFRTMCHTFITGSTGSGKTTLLDFLLYLERDLYNIVLFISATQPAIRQIGKKNIPEYLYDWSDLKGPDNDHEKGIKAIKELLSDIKKNKIAKYRYAIILDDIVADLTEKQTKDLLQFAVNTCRHDGCSLYVLAQNVMQIHKQLRGTFHRCINIGVKNEEEAFALFKLQFSSCIEGPKNKNRFAKLVMWMQKNKGNAIIYDSQRAVSNLVPNSSYPDLWQFAFPEQKDIPPYILCSRDQWLAFGEICKSKETLEKEKQLKLKSEASSLSRSLKPKSSAKDEFTKQQIANAIVKIKGESN